MKSFISTMKSFIVTFTKKQRRQLRWIIVLMTISAVLETVGVGAVIPLMTALVDKDIIKNSEIVGTVCNYMNITSYKEFVVLCAVGIVVVYLIKNVFVFVQIRTQNSFIYKNRRATQKKILGIILSRSYESFLGQNTSEIMQEVNFDVNQTYTLLQNILSLMAELFISAALICSILIINPKVTVIIGSVVFVSLYGISRIISPKIKRFGVTYRDNNKKVGMWIIQAVSGIKEIKVASKEDFFVHKFEEVCNQAVEAQEKSDFWKQMPKGVLEIIAISVAMIIVTGVTFMDISVEMLLPTLSAVGLAIVRLLPSTAKISQLINNYSFSDISLKRMVATVSSNVSNNTFEKKKHEALKVTNGIEVKGVSYSYPETERKILNQANMTIAAHTSVGIVGPSGSGKTTLVDIILGLLTIDEGVVEVDSVDINECIDSWHANIGYIPQFIFLLDDSIRANVGFGISNDNYNDEMIWYALEKAQLADFVRTLPEGLDTQIGERGVKLSGGQRQRLGIARALFFNPDVLVFDEATSALDNETEKAIMDSINGLHGEKTMIIIAHRLSTIEGCDCVYKVENGLIERVR